MQAHKKIGKMQVTVFTISVFEKLVKNSPKWHQLDSKTRQFYFEFCCPFLFWKKMQHTSRLLTRSKPYSRSSSIKSRQTQHSKRITEESETESASKVSTVFYGTKLGLFQQAKPFTLHCALLFVVLIYSFIAGMIFRWLESEHLENKHQMEWQKKLVCVHQVILLEINPYITINFFQVFDNATALSYRNYKPINSTLEEIIHCFVAKMDAKSTWGPLTAAFYGFGIATTLG